MSERNLLEGLISSPVTQSVDSVKALIAFYNHGQAPENMPAFYRLSSDMVLVLSNRKDSFYVVTSKACSCPAATYHPGAPCKHARKYFPQPTVSSRMEIDHSSFRPVLEAV